MKIHIMIHETKQLTERSPVSSNYVIYNKKPSANLFMESTEDLYFTNSCIYENMHT